MLCKVCGKELYESITFSTLFKWRYDIHENCAKTARKVDDSMVFPLYGVMVEYNAVFKTGYPQSDWEYLFTWYMGNMLYKHLYNRTWSVIILIDDIQNHNDLQLVIPLADSQVLMLSMFEEEIVENE